MIGKTLGQYKLLDEIGRGGMGVVYLAEHVELGMRYALKVLPEELSRSAAFVRRFKTEARIMARLNHPGIVRVFDLTSEREHYFLVMDLVLSPAGKPKHLGHLIEERGGKLPPDKALDVALQVCEALEYAHTYADDLVKDGVVHRDLKPANVLVGPDGKLRISDFGLAKIIGGDFVLSRINESFSRSVGDRKTATPPRGSAQAELGESVGGQPTVPQGSPHTSDEAILGTYDYMSPEQKDPRRVAAVDCRSDIFSLGVIAYRMLTGRKPEGRFKLPSELDARFSQDWDAILIRALQQDPEDRFVSVDEMRREFRGLSGTSETGRRSERPQEEPVLAEGSESVGQPEEPASSGKRYCDLCGWRLTGSETYCSGCGADLQSDNQ